MDIVEWMKAGLQKPGKTQVGLAKALGRSPSVVTNILAGIRELKLREIPLVANYLEIQPPTAVAAPSPYDDINEPALVELPVLGEVAAGVWADEDADLIENETLLVPYDPRFEPEDQYLLKVRGSSINRRAVNGSFVRCLKLFAAPRKPQDGDWVIVRRMRNGSAETTVKRFRISPDGQRQLWPDSTDPIFQEPIVVSATDGDEVAIVAFVLDFINPATRF